MPSSGSRNAVNLLKYTGDILIFLMVILNGYSINILVFFRISIELSWVLGLKKWASCWLCHPPFFLPWVSTGLPLGIILKILQKGGVLFLRSVPGFQEQKFLLPLTQNFCHFWSRAATSLQNFPPFCYIIILTNLSITREPLPHFSEWVGLFRVMKSEIKNRSMTNFEPEETHNDSTAANSFIKC